MLHAYKLNTICRTKSDEKDFFWVDHLPFTCLGSFKTIESVKHVSCRPDIYKKQIKKIQNTFAMVKHISRQGVASVCLMSLNWCKTPRGRPETSLSGSGRRTKIQRKTIRRLNKTVYQRAREEWEKIKYNEKLK